MQGLKRNANVIGYVGGAWLLLGWGLACLLFPWKMVLGQGYFELGYWHTILGLFRPILIRAIVWTSPVLVVLLASLKFARWRNAARETWVGTGFLAIFLVFLLGLGGVAAEQAFHRPEAGHNVILIVVDTLRPDFTSLTVTGQNNTPHLKEKLLPGAVYFPRAYANAPWTLPSVASLLTSRYPSALPISNLVSRLQDSHLTMAEILKEHGYYTGAVISHMLLKNIYGFGQGFDDFNARNIEDKYGNHASISSPGVTADAIAFLRRRQKNKFFLFLHYFDPHYMYLDHDHSCPYQGRFGSWDINELRGWIRDGQYNKANIDYLKCCYGSELRFTDRYLGQLLAEVRKLGLYEDSLIILTGDHGEEFVERGWLGHSTTLYDEQIHVPLLIKLPLHESRGPDHHRPAANFVSNLDILPTVLQTLHIDQPAQLQGRGLLCPIPSGKDAVFSELHHRDFGYLIDRVAVIQDQWKLILDPDRKNYQLYNLGEDPGELRNVIDQAPPILAALKMKLIRWQRTNRGRDSQPGKGRGSLTDEETRRLKSLGYL